ncbi:Retrotransposon gag protein [Gossypium australe]|uniref:Retrotransposon gag protein n=1 Tax=Gossypium australe TaxID=47621 RepID=A0A5B6VPS0_9ROSI|nr:Retrotransposon gag protein [Gossypium australe]
MAQRTLHYYNPNDPKYLAILKEHDRGSKSTPKALCDTFKYNEVTYDSICLWLLPLSLCDHATDWLDSLEPSSITTWDELAGNFLHKIFPINRSIQLHREIVNFKQLKDEILYEAWDRFKSLLRKCPHRGMQ